MRRQIRREERPSGPAGVRGIVGKTSNWPGEEVLSLAGRLLDYKIFAAPPGVVI